MATPHPDIPPLKLRLFLALSQLGWPAADATDAADAADGPASTATQSHAPHGGWSARLAPGHGESANRSVEIWHGDGRWRRLEPRPQLTASGAHDMPHGASGPGPAAIAVPRPLVLEGAWRAAGQGASTAAAIDDLTLPPWLRESAPFWCVRAQGFAIDHVYLPGNTAREQLSAADSLVHIDGRMAAALGTCEPGSLAIELRTGRRPRLLVRRPPPRVCTWILGDDDDAQRTAQFGMALGAQQIVALHVAPHVGASQDGRRSQDGQRSQNGQRSQHERTTLTWLLA